MDTKYKDKLMSVLTDIDNAIAVGEVLKLQNDWMDKIENQYIWSPLESFANSIGLEFGKDSGEGSTGAWINKKEWKNYKIIIWPKNDSRWKDMCVGISWYGEKPKRKNLIYKKDWSKLDCFSSQEEEDWPYGFEYLPDNIRYWGYDITEEIVQGKVFEYIKTKFQEILAEIEERKLPMP